MSVVAYTSLQLERLGILELERIAVELGLVGLKGRDELVMRILQWQAGKNQPLTQEFSAGMMVGPALEAYAELLDFYDVKKLTAQLLEALSPLALGSVLAKIKVLPTLPTSPHSARIAYLLMQDRLEVTVPTGTSAVHEAIRQLHTYSQRKDRIITYLMQLNDAALFAVVDQLGEDLVHADPYVQINGVRYDDRLAVVYYLVVLQVR